MKLPPLDQSRKIEKIFNIHLTKKNAFCYNQIDQLLIKIIDSLKTYESNYVKNVAKIRKKRTSKKEPFIAFGFKENQPLSVIKLKNLITELTHGCDLVDLNQVSKLHEILVSKNIDDCRENIYLKCETTEFTFIINKLKRYFENLKPVNVGRSKLFHSKDNASLITENNFNASFAKAKRHNYEKIIKIFNKYELNP